MFEKLYIDFVVFNKSTKYVGNREKLYKVDKKEISKNVTILTLHVSNDFNDKKYSYSFAVLTSLKKNFKIDLSKYPEDIQESDVMRAMPS